MSQATRQTELSDALAGLLNKYAVAVDGRWRLAETLPPGESEAARLLVPGYCVGAANASDSVVPLLPWRHERRFVELKRLIDEQTVAPLLMCRFACLTDGREMPLEAILYREFDLLEWVSGRRIIGVYASISENGDGSNLPDRPENGGANVIVRLDNGVVGSVEAGTTLTAGAAMQDRHELIARRGVASDRVVDSQVAQSSVYAWTEAGRQQHTDVDAELFGLDAARVSLVRAAYEVLCEPRRSERLLGQHRRLRRLVELACESDRRRQRLAVEGGTA